ncbi:hypothetical protein EN947_07945 [Mesorhizobium sp. M7A.F.Ca.US.003.02.2.1]|nr:hypothetical protein EN991_35510 [Mesorhizobium sp. M7A.F.Ca.US.005.03.2.1]RUZ57161.1 hypothetical protein EN950_25455 [Mesorhizobium sp. M7A.F.Ca.US.007.01.1.1]RUZ89180.1 hypothetical protein EN947_07945 [Mesorhizobium sp. M7A.F.Ca.US.003.02.2.1]
MNPCGDLPRHAAKLQEAGRKRGCATRNACASENPLFCTAKAERAKNAYGRRIARAIDLAMRYVIVIAAIAFFLIWDGMYNQGRYLDTTVRELSHVVRYVTGRA